MKIPEGRASTYVASYPQPLDSQLKDQIYTLILPKLAHHFGPLYNHFKESIDSHPAVQHKIDALLSDLYGLVYDALKKVKKDQIDVDFELFEDDSQIILEVMGLMFTTEPNLEVYPDDKPIIEWAKELWDVTKTYYIDSLRRYIAKNDWQECEKAIDRGRKEIRPIIKKILAIALEYVRSDNEDDCENEDGA